MENLGLIVFCVLIGYFFAKKDIFSNNASEVLNKFVIYISLPAMILLYMPKIEFSTVFLTPIVIVWSVSVFSAVLTFFVSKWFRFSKEVTGALMLVSVLGNTSFLGIPLVDAYFGKEAMPYLVVYDQLGSFLLLVTYGSFIVSYYALHAEVGIGNVVKKIAFFPPFLAMILALCLHKIQYWQCLNITLDALSSTITPLALVAVGLQLKFKIKKSDLKPFFTSIFIKMFISPIFALFVAFLFGFKGLGLDVSIVESAMPSMITAGAMASMAGLAPRLTNAIVGYGIVISLFSTYAIYRILITSFV